MSGNGNPLLFGLPFSSYTDAGSAFAIPQLLQIDKRQILNKFGIEEASPPADDLLQHIVSTFTSQETASNPAKAIISLLLGLTTQIDKLTSEDIDINAPEEIIDAHGNRRILSYAEKARRAVAAKLPSELGRVLANAGLTHPHTSLQVQVNHNGTVTCIVSPSTPAKDLTAYFPGLLAVLNLACHASENPFNEFQLAPTNTDYAVHNVPLFALPEHPDLFMPEITEAVALATGASISHVNFLSKPENREGKNTTSIVISVPAEDIDKIVATIHLFGRSRRCNKL
ncbi:uncharacterized protein H6S33_013157 [Morchella sextelata]|uniref:uncharacterized protein n=1 Tax=Morchella sextelata TaxID=1174677 RepID=UPI001D059D22|nr:uncharacterized protein H6S33_013157 [Morchella sextelata]KAH0609671.1 hypothetical protein H6S33_013157 [Morchella sextelata]